MDTHTPYTNMRDVHFTRASLPTLRSGALMVECGQTQQYLEVRAQHRPPDASFYSETQGPDNRVTASLHSLLIF